MIRKITTSLLLSFLWITLFAQDSSTIKMNKVLNTQSLLLLKTNKIKSDTIKFVTPKHVQGFFCNFEDQLNRKKVPIDFSLGNSKY